jgi:hypothetical protein
MPETKTQEHCVLAQGHRVIAQAYCVLLSSAAQNSHVV